MFPQVSNFRSGEGGSAWFRFTDPETDEQFLYQSQWETIVRKFQTNAKRALMAGDVALFGFDPKGTCIKGDSLFEVPAIWRSNIRKTETIAVDGQWGPQTAELLGFLLCVDNDTEAAKLLANDNASKTVSAEILRYILWIAFLVNPMDWDWKTGGNALPARTRTMGSGIKLAAGTLLPTYQANPVMDTRDRDWWASSQVNTLIPNPPSKGGKTRPWPASSSGSSGKSSGGTLLLLFALAGIGYYATRDRT